MSARFFDHHGSAQQSPLREQLVFLMRDLRASLAARVEVAKVEFRASAHELVGGVVALVAAGLFAIGAWGTVCALLVVGLVALGLGLLPALLVVAVLNAIFAAVALSMARKHLAHVGMKHTYQAFLGHHQRDPEQQLAEQVHAAELRTRPDAATRTPVQEVHHGAA